MASDVNTTPIAERRELPWLNVLKLLCALMVVHIHLPVPYREYFLPLCDIAVPVFFMISGYFLTDENGMFDITRIKRSMWKIAKIILFAQALYIPVTLVSGYRHGNDLATLILNERDWIEMVIFGSWPHEPLWYLTAFIEALAIIIVISRFKPMEKLQDLVVLIIVTLITQILICYLIIGPEVTDGNRYLAHTFLWPALPCIAIGSIIRKKGILPRLTSLTTALIFLIPVIYFVDNNAELTGGRMHIASQTASVSIAAIVFMVFLSMHNSSPAVMRLASLGRNHSRNIYIIHSLCGLIVLNVLPWLPDSLLAGTAFVISIIVSAGWNAMQTLKDKIFMQMA